MFGDIGLTESALTPEGWGSRFRDAVYGMYLQVWDDGEYARWNGVREGRALYLSLDGARRLNESFIAEFHRSLEKYEMELDCIRVQIREKTLDKVGLIRLTARARDVDPILTPAAILHMMVLEERHLLTREKLLVKLVDKKTTTLKALEAIDQGLQLNMTDAVAVIENANMALHTRRLCEITQTAPKIATTASYNAIKNNTQKILGDLTRVHERMDAGAQDHKECIEDLTAPAPDDMRFFHSVCAEVLSQKHVSATDTPRGACGFDPDARIDDVPASRGVHDPRPVSNGHA